MFLNSGFALVSLLWLSVTVDCRSIGEPVGVNCPDQANYQDYGEQQEYVERQVRDVEDRPGKYRQKEYAREPLQSSNQGLKVAPEAAYQSRDNGDDEDAEGAAPAERAAVDRRELEERDEKKGEDSVDAEVADQRNDEGLRQGPNDIPQSDAGYRQPRENQAEVDPQEPAKMTEAAGSQAAEAGYDAMNEAQAEPAKDDSYVAGDYTNYDYAPEQGPQDRAEGQQNLEQNVAPGNEDAAPPSQYEQGN